MRIAVLGAGAIGGFTAAALGRSGAEVVVVARGAHLEAIRKNGLRARSELGDFTVRIPAADDLRKHDHPFDYLLLTFKAHQWPGFLAQLEPYAGTGTALVTLQNGVPFWFERTPALQSVDPGGEIGALFADSQIIGGVLNVSGNIAAPGVVEQSRGMRYPLGELDGRSTSRLQKLCESFAHAGLHAERQTNIREPLWIKLLNNASQNPVSALTGKSIHEMLRDPSTRVWIRELMQETLAVGQAMQVVGDIDIDERIAIAERQSDVKTSMLQDLQAGRPLELDPLLGATIELGKRHGIVTPRLQDAYDRLKQYSAS